MKVDIKIIVGFLDSIKYLIQDIFQTARSGDDGFLYCIEEQVHSIEAMMNNFKSVELANITKKKAPNEPGYVRQHEKLLQQNKPVFEQERHESDAEFKSKLYAFIKRKMREIPADTMIQQANGDLFNFLFAEIITDDTPYLKMFQSNEWSRSCDVVLFDVVNEIIEERKRNPQLQLF